MIVNVVFLALVAILAKLVERWVEFIALAVQKLVHQELIVLAGVVIVGLAIIVVSLTAVEAVEVNPLLLLGLGLNGVMSVAG